MQQEPPASQAVTLLDVPKDLPRAQCQKPHPIAPEYSLTPINVSCCQCGIRRSETWFLLIKGFFRVYVEQPVSNRPQFILRFSGGVGSMAPTLGRRWRVGHADAARQPCVNKQWLDFLQKRLRRIWKCRNGSCRAVLPMKLGACMWDFCKKPSQTIRKNSPHLPSSASSNSRREENESIWRGHEIPSGFPTCRASLVKRLAKGAFRRPPAKPFVFPFPFAPPPYGYRHVQTFADCDGRF